MDGNHVGLHLVMECHNCLEKNCFTEKYLLQIFLNFKSKNIFPEYQVTNIMSGKIWELTPSNDQQHEILTAELAKYKKYPSQDILVQILHHRNIYNRKGQNQQD